MPAVCSPFHFHNFSNLILCLNKYYRDPRRSGGAVPMMPFWLLAGPLNNNIIIVIIIINIIIIHAYEVKSLIIALYNLILLYCTRLYILLL